MTFEKRKGVSPVIATVILVAVAITVAVGVSYWMGGISSQYTQFEKVEISTGWSEKDSGGQGWTIHITLKNSGSATATITHVFVNDLPIVLTDPATASLALTTDGEFGCNIVDGGLTLEAGEENDTVEVYVALGGVAGDPTFLLSSGTTLNIKLHSAGGMDYIKLVRLA
jgi:flagellin-like protein